MTARRSRGSILWAGKLRPCLGCRQTRRKCEYPIDQNTCYQCAAFRVSCSGPVVPTTGRGTSVSNHQLIVSPSGVGAELARFTLSLALSFHLIQVNQGLTADQRAWGKSLPKTHLYHASLTLNTPGTTVDVEEVLGLISMGQGAIITSHSAVVGSSLSEITPPLADVLLGISRDIKKENLAKYGLARRPVLDYFWKKLMSLLEQHLSPRSVPSDLAVILKNIDWGHLSDAQLEEGTSVIREAINAFLAEDSVGTGLCADPKAALLKDLKPLMEIEVLLSWSTGRNPLYRGLHLFDLTSSSCPMSNLSNEELRFLVSSSVEIWGSANALRLSGSVADFFQKRREHHHRLLWELMKMFSSPSVLLEEAIGLCWSTVLTLTETMNDEITKLLGHAQYGAVATRGVRTVLIRFLMEQMELHTLLTGCRQEATQRGGPILEKSEVQIMSSWSRIAVLWKLLQEEHYPFRQDDVHSQLTLVESIYGTLRFCAGPLLIRWGQQNPNEATILLQPLQLASYFYYQAGEIFEELTNALHYSTLFKTLPTNISWDERSLANYIVSVSLQKLNDTELGYPVKKTKIAQIIVGNVLEKLSSPTIDR